jgi:hypothetical protein
MIIFGHGLTSGKYDIVTSPITTSHFHSRVLTLLSTHLSSTVDDVTRNHNASPIEIPPLNPADSDLTPTDSISQVIGVTSSWTDLCSPDPVIADVSRQVLQLELTYAAFCGLTYILVHGPRLRGHGVSSTDVANYGRAILDGLNSGPYMQLYLWMPMIDYVEDDVEQIGDLAPFSRPQFVESEIPRRLDVFGSWEAWNMVRSMCKYPSRLSVGERRCCPVPFSADDRSSLSSPIPPTYLDSVAVVLGTSSPFDTTQRCLHEQRKRLPRPFSGPPSTHSQVCTATHHAMVSTL